MEREEYVIDNFTEGASQTVEQAVLKKMAVAHTKHGLGAALLGFDAAHGGGSQWYGYWHGRHLVTVVHLEMFLTIHLCGLSWCWVYYILRQLLHCASVVIRVYLYAHIRF